MGWLWEGLCRVFSLVYVHAGSYAEFMQGLGAFFAADFCARLFGKRLEIGNK